MINLFEYQNTVDYARSTDELETFLDEIWKKREKSDYFRNEDKALSESQRFLKFFRKNNELKSNKYVGVIHFEGEQINLLPKICFEEGREYDENAIGQIHKHVLWWLSYCRKIKFPSYQTALGSNKSDFFEILIYMFSKYTRELLNNTMYQKYEEVDRELSFVKGRINTNKYITENISRGRWHKLNCVYDSFELDNSFNRIVKHVTTLLFRHTKNQDNKKHLREILFLLDEVSDVQVSAEDCLRIKFNPMFEEFATVRDYCHLFLSNSVSFNYKKDLKLFAFLLPMEYVFEDFVFGFIEKELPNIKSAAQVGGTSLVRGENFALKPDLIIQTPSKKLIADTKYKIVYTDKSDPKKGLSQSDLYQMLAYAVRFNIDQVILFYPNTISHYQEQVAELVIEDELADKREILIQAFQLPILNVALFEEVFDRNVGLDELFAGTREGLKEVLQGVLLDAPK